MGQSGHNHKYGKNNNLLVGTFTIVWLSPFTIVQKSLCKFSQLLNCKAETYHHMNFIHTESKKVIWKLKLQFIFRQKKNLGRFDKTLEGRLDHFLVKDLASNLHISLTFIYIHCTSWVRTRVCPSFFTNAIISGLLRIKSVKEIK